MRTAHSFFKQQTVGQFDLQTNFWSVLIQIQVATELTTNIKYRNDLDDDKSDAVTV